MIADFPHSYPPTTATPVVGKPVDVQTLQDAFASVLRSYGTETTTNAMLEVIRPTSHSDDTNGDTRNQQRREQHQQIDRNDSTNIERKLLEKSEVRSSEMNADYRERTDRNETLRNDYQERVERNELRQQAVQPNISNSVISPSDAQIPSELVPGRELSSPRHNIPATADTNSPVLATNVPNGTPNIGQTNVLLPGSTIPVSLPRTSAPPVVPPQAFTVFTPSGRLGQSQKKTDEDEQEDEESVEETETKKYQPFAVFEAIQAEATRQTRHNFARQPKEPGSSQTTEKFDAKTREVEQDQSRSIKTIEELLNTSLPNVVVSKKGESNQPNQTQYLNRIAAACEVAAHYAPIRMKLNLDHLGTLTLRFFHTSDKLALRFETPSKESARFLQNNLEDLRTILSKRNVKIASIEIHETSETQS